MWSDILISQTFERIEATEENVMIPRWRQRSMFLAAALCSFAVVCAGQDKSSGVKHVLFFSKAADWEQKILHRDGDQLSYVEKAVQKLGEDNHIDITFSKDGTIFTPENIAKFDGFFFFTSGDLTFEKRTGKGDNYPLMTLEGKKAFLDAIQNGKGFIGCNEAMYTFIQPLSPGEENTPANVHRYTKMIGGGYIGHNEVQAGHFSYLDRKFPGMENLPADYQPVDQWYAFRDIMPDLHVIMALDSGKLTGNLYGRPNYPIVWARMEGKGRVYYTTMGHAPEIWKDPRFLQMLLGAIRWITGMVDADITPDMATLTPQANEIPQGARKFVATHPTLMNPHFPGLPVWLDQEYPTTSASKHVLVYSKSAGYEHPVVYRDTAWPTFVEKVLLEWGQESNIDFVFSKDGAIFTPENIAKYDAFLFYTSGDPTNQPRNGPGDNYPLMTQEEKDGFLKAVREGKGFMGVHCAIETFSHAPALNADPYRKMLGADYVGYDHEQDGHLIQVDKSFPGMDAVPADFTSAQEWYALKHFLPDLHVILALDCAKMEGNIYRRPNYPVAWARMEGKGRVYYTILGHSEEDWNSPVFRQMILGAVRWTTGMAEADVTPNLANVTPQANKIPKPARLALKQ
jgi:type 1 glutamine amidotransferase